MTDDRIRELVRRPPKLHVHRGRPISWGINRALADLLRREVSARSRTLETGAGVSTLIFLLLGATHDAISPDPDEASKILAYCTEHRIPTDRYVHHLARSEAVLPTLPLEPGLDLVLVDGDHAFPIPCLDWFYAARRLRRGGLMVLDDVSLWSVRIVADFLSADDAWQQIERSRRFAAYRLLVDPDRALSRWWGEQRHVVARSGALSRWLVRWL